MRAAPWNHCSGNSGLPEANHYVTRPGRLRKRMAARLHRTQPAKAAPAPPGRMRSGGPLAAAGTCAIQDRGLPAESSLQDPDLPIRGLCDRVGYASRALVVRAAQQMKLLHGA